MLQVAFVLSGGRWGGDYSRCSRTQAGLLRDSGPCQTGFPAGFQEGNARPMECPRAPRCRDASGGLVPLTTRVSATWRRDHCKCLAFHVSLPVRKSDRPPLGCSSVTPQRGPPPGFPGPGLPRPRPRHRKDTAPPAVALHLRPSGCPWGRRWAWASGTSQGPSCCRGSSGTSTQCRVAATARPGGAGHAL